MDNSLYNKMTNLKEDLDAKDIRYLGKISLNDTDLATNKDFKIEKDIFVGDKKEKDGFIKLYDENGEIIAVINENGIFPSSKYSNILSKGENIDALFLLRQYAEKEGISLNSTNKELETISKELGISKEEILALSKVSYDEDEKEENKKDNKININEDNKEENELEKEKNEDALNKISSKQKASLNQKIDGYHTLGNILGVPDNGELIVVYSDSIEKNENNTRFSFLIKDSKGNITKPENLNQISGNRSSLNIAESNMDGSKVTDKQVYSSYSIKGPSNIDYVLTADIGTYGYIDLGFGQIDRTKGYNGDDSRAITVPIATTNTYYQRTEPNRELVGDKQGTLHTTERVNEYNMHKENDCENITSKDADGIEETGHKHDIKEFESDNVSNIDIVAQRIYNSNDDISNAFSEKDIKNMLVNAINKHPDYNMDEIERIVENDCEAFIDSINRHRTY